MSLILDALRKLERDKDARAPGILVVGSVPWGETSRARRMALTAWAASGEMTWTTIPGRARP